MRYTHRNAHKNTSQNRTHRTHTQKSTNIGGSIIYRNVRFMRLREWVGRVFVFSCCCLSKWVCIRACLCVMNSATCPLLAHLHWLNRFRSMRRRAVVLLPKAALKTHTHTQNPDLTDFFGNLAKHHHQHGERMRRKQCGSRSCDVSVPSSNLHKIFVLVAGTRVEHV